MFAVRCVSCTEKVGGDEDSTYEERITLWNVSSAEWLSSGLRPRRTSTWSTYRGQQPRMAQSYALFDVPGDGAEVFLADARQRLSPDDYLTTHFDTGTERQTDVASAGDASR